MAIPNNCSSPKEIRPVSYTHLNWFIQLIDYAINFGETQCRLVVMGNKVDLAVNGRYLGSGEPYQPIASLPVYVSVLAGISCVLGFLMNSWLGLCLGAVSYTHLDVYKRQELLFVMTVQVTGDRTDRIGIAAELIYLKAHLCKIGLIALQQMGFPG